MNQEKIWDAIAEQWHHFRQGKVETVYGFLGKYCDKKGKILEIGCGNARNLIPFAKLNFECYGVDFSKKMLENADKYARKNNVNIRLLKSDMTSLSFEDDYFDYVLYVSSLHHLDNEEKRLKALKEAYRVLKKNGLMLLSVWNKLQFRFIFRSKDLDISWRFKDKKYDRYYHLFDYFELRKLVKIANFSILEYNIFGGNLVFVLKKIKATDQI